MYGKHKNERKEKSDKKLQPLSIEQKEKSLKYPEMFVVFIFPYLLNY